MGRPRKRDDTPEAKQRIVDAFWKLLESHTLRQISVGMIAQHACCNRGTFYYHYDSIDDLTLNAIRNEFYSDTGLATFVFNTITGIDPEHAVSNLSAESVARLACIVRQGGRDIVERTVKSLVLDMWTSVLCPDGGAMDERTRLLVEYIVSGLLGVLTYCSSAERGVEHPFEPDATFLAKTSSFTISCISEFEGLSEEEILLRLKVVNQFSRVARGGSA